MQSTIKKLNKDSFVNKNDLNVKAKEDNTSDSSFSSTITRTIHVESDGYEYCCLGTYSSYPFYVRAVINSPAFPQYITPAVGILATLVGQYDDSFAGNSLSVFQSSWLPTTPSFFIKSSTKEIFLRRQASKWNADISLNGFSTVSGELLSSISGATEVLGHRNNPPQYSAGDENTPMFINNFEAHPTSFSMYKVDELPPNPDVNIGSIFIVKGESI